MSKYRVLIAFFTPIAPLMRINSKNIFLLQHPQSLHRSCQAGHKPRLLSPVLKTLAKATLASGQLVAAEYHAKIHRPVFVGLGKGCPYRPGKRLREPVSSPSDFGWDGTPKYRPQPWFNKFSRCTCCPAAKRQKLSIRIILFLDEGITVTVNVW